MYKNFDYDQLVNMPPTDFDKLVERVVEIQKEEEKKTQQSNKSRRKR